MAANFSSLRRRLVVPLLAASSVAAVVVALASYWLAASRAQAEAREKFAAMERVVQESNFPLTRNVLDMLGKLTGALWFSVDAQGAVLDYSSTVDGDSNAAPLATEFSLDDLPQSNQDVSPKILKFAGKNYQVMRFGSLDNRRTATTDAVRDVVVLIDDSLRERTLYRAAALPLLTGLSTIVLLTSIAWFMTERLIQRIAKLQHEVDGIARGDFQRSIQSGSEDELGLLSQSVQKMAEQLNQMWQALRQRHGQQLLHQISGGLAHNLRNTLTGARMAIELVQRQLIKPKLNEDLNQSGSSTNLNVTQHRSAEVDGLGIALSQLEQAEAYVQRLLLVSRGQEAKLQPAIVLDCLEGLRAGLDNTAEHRGVKLDWRYADALAGCRVADGPTLIAAISNLVWNAIEAGKTVSLTVELKSKNWCLITIEDDGPGPPENLRDQLFDPFVTSKSEGLGLGLPLVRRAAEALSGQVQWRRQQDRTIFEFSFPILREELNK